MKIAIVTGTLLLAVCVYVAVVAIIANRWKARK